MRSSLIGLAALMSIAGSTGALAQAAAPPLQQSMAEAVAEDAREYARLYGVGLADAIRRVRAQEDSVAATDRLRAQHGGRLAGISIQHRPDYRIVVLLTGEAPVPTETVLAGGMQVPVEFRTGARATREQVLEALEVHQPAIRAAYPNAQGMGLDQRTGELVLMLKGDMVDPDEAARAQAKVELLAGVPVRIRALDRADLDMSVEGGSRLVGIDPADGRAYACTTGFVVTDGARNGVLTAAHCPDEATYVGADGARVPLGLVGQWGARYQDVQVHVGADFQGPFFFADRERRSLRTVERARARASTRAGDVVCHRGEATGYSCAEVELTDFSPPGALCAGPCDPVWVSVAGPGCRNGDSGGPVFNGTVAFGITKGGSYTRGRCNFYYYMSTDFLPEGWRLLIGANQSAGAGAAPRRTDAKDSTRSPGL